MIYINQNFSQFIPLSLVGSSYTEFRVGTSTPTAIVVDWGDGSTTSYSGSLMTISHTYSSPFTGDMKISCPSGNTLITILDEFSVSNTSNSIAFTISQIGGFNNLSTFICIENNVITGNIANLPSGLLNCSIGGNNTTTGDIANLPSGLLNYYNIGLNTTYGDISNLPVTLELYRNEGNNTTTGDIANLPSGLLTCTIGGLNTTYGDIANLPSGLLNYYNFGNSAVTGNITNLPSGLLECLIGGNNTTTGDIANLPSGLLNYYNIGLNTTYGDISNLPVGISSYFNIGTNSVIDYTISRIWANPMHVFIELPNVPGGLESAEVDNLLIDLSTPTWLPYSVGATMELDISGNNAPRTSVSDAAVALLLSKGVIVTTN